jgi:hypothetical protein
MDIFGTNLYSKIRTPDGKSINDSTYSVSDGDVIVIEIGKKKVLFSNKTKKTKKKEFPFSFKPVPFVNLYYSEGKIEILKK